jgi:hypothetical protein
MHNAHIRGVDPCLSALLTAAPAPINISTILLCPPAQAAIRGVHPIISLALFKNQSRIQCFKLVSNFNTQFIAISRQKQKHIYIRNMLFKIFYQPQAKEMNLKHKIATL